MSSPTEIEPFVLGNFEKRKRVLDIGVGFGKNGYIMRVFDQPKLLIWGDAFLPYLRIVKYHRIYDNVVLHHASFLPSKNEAFDVTIASEVIEHLDRRAGLVFLVEVERVACERIVIATPNRAEMRGGALTSAGFNPWEAHKSSWTVGDFKKRGYKVLGTGLLLHRHLGSLAMFLTRCLCTLLHGFRV